jgi:hypothetical protein
LDRRPRFAARSPEAGRTPSDVPSQLPQHRSVDRDEVHVGIARFPDLCLQTIGFPVQPESDPLLKPLPVAPT